MVCKQDNKICSLKAWAVNQVKNLELGLKPYLLNLETV